MDYSIDLNSTWRLNRQIQVACERNVIFRRQVHYCMEIVLTFSGVMDLEIGGEAYSLEPGEAVFILPLEPHAFLSRRENRTCILDFEQDTVPAFAEFLQNKVPVKRKIRLPDTLLAYFDSLLSKDGAVRSWDLLTAQAVLGPLVSEFSRRGSFEVGESHRDSAFLEALRVIHGGYNEKLSLAAVARQVGLMPETLSRKFHALAGVTFGSYVRHLRVLHACDLLRQGSNATEAAMASGFGSVRSFNRVFEELTGITPTEYKKTQPELRELLRF